MYKNYFLVGLLVLCSILGFRLNQNYNLSKNIEHALKKDIEELSRSKDIVIDNHQNLMEKLYSYNFTTIKKDIDLIDLNNKSHKLENIINDNTLIYRISDNVCNVCYDAVIKELGNFVKKKNKIDIIILVPIGQIRELVVYLKELQANISFYGIQENGLGDSLEVDQYSPFFFVLDETMIVKHIFIPKKSEDQTLNDYLYIINSRYSKS